MRSIISTIPHLLLLLLSLTFLAAVPAGAEQMAANRVSTAPDAGPREEPGISGLTHMDSLSAVSDFAANGMLWLLLGVAGLVLGGAWLGRRTGAPAEPPLAPRIVHPPARDGAGPGRGMDTNAGNEPGTQYWISLDQATTVTVDELSNVEEEAEVFLLLGRMDMAIGVLRHHVEANDGAPAHIWMSLLDVLHVQGLRQEFEKLAAEIRERFNVALPTWEGANARSNELSGLEHFPHLLARITARWKEPDCLNYLQELIQDNRNGERGGFHLEAFRELLMLIGMLEHKEKLAASQPQPV